MFVCYGPNAAQLAVLDRITYGHTCIFLIGGTHSRIDKCALLRMLTAIFVLEDTFTQWRAVSESMVCVHLEALANCFYVVVSPALLARQQPLLHHFLGAVKEKDEFWLDPSLHHTPPDWMFKYCMNLWCAAEPEALVAISLCKYDACSSLPGSQMQLCSPHFGGSHL